MSTENKDLPTLKPETVAMTAELVKAGKDVYDKKEHTGTVSDDIYHKLAVEHNAALTADTLKAAREFNTLFFAAATNAAGEIVAPHLKKGDHKVAVVEFGLGGKDSWEVTYTRDKEVSGGIPKEGEPTPPKKTVYGTTLTKLNVYGAGNVGELGKVKTRLSASARELFS